MSIRSDHLSRGQKSVEDTIPETNRTSTAAESVVSRRSAISQMALVGTTGLVTVSGLSSDLSASSRSAGFSAQRLSYADWKELVGQSFRLRAWAGIGPEVTKRIWLTLDEVIENSWVAARDKDRPAWMRRAPVSLLFSSREVIQSATYEFDNRILGRNRFFTNQVFHINKRRQLTYEVVLN